MFEQRLEFKTMEMTMNLFGEYQMGPLRLPHRLVMAPMTRNRAPGTVPTEMMATYYRQRATAAFIVTEATQVDPMGQGYPNTPGIHSEEQAAAWMRVTDAVHEEGGRIFLQLWHVGRISHSAYHDGARPVAPSAVRPAGRALLPTMEQVPFETPRALETDEVREVVEQYRRGAARAREAGFDGVEVHGANGYLIDQFLHSNTNRRTDRYGGSVENGVRFLREVTEAVAGEWESGRVGVRLAPANTFNDMHDANRTETFTHAARALDAFDLAYLHVVDGEVDGRPARALMREAYDGTLVVASEYDRESGEAVLERGEADLIAYGRPFLANPDLPARFRDNAPLNEPNPKTFYGGDAEGYVDYPVLEEATV